VHLTSILLVFELINVIISELLIIHVIFLLAAVVYGSPEILESYGAIRIWSGLQVPADHRQ
jgi:hypothetical protein